MTTVYVVVYDDGHEPGGSYELAEFSAVFSDLAEAGKYVAERNESYYIVNSPLYATAEEAL